MSDGTKIPWADATWNPSTGCTKVSPGCANCYAVRAARRFDPHEELTARHPNGQLDWTGTVRLHPARLDQPLRWRKPRRVFVNSMSDLFHETVQDRFIAATFAVMRFAYWHQFLVLTKRCERMRELLSDPEFPLICDREIGGSRNLDWLRAWEREGTGPPIGWPLPNVWLGVSVENQAAADERIPLLLQTPAATRFISCEPLLGPIALHPWLWETAEPGWAGEHPSPEYPSPDLSWCIVGGESGPQARPCDVEWIRSIVEQCQAAQAPAYVKQLGSNAVQSVYQGHHEHLYDTGERIRPFPLIHPKGGALCEWPDDLRVRQFPEVPA